MTHPVDLSIRPPFPDKVDSSIMSTFDSCETKGFYNYLHHLSPSLTSPDLHAGGAFARGIEIVRHHLWVTGDSLEVALTKGIRAFTEFWGDYDPPEGHNKTYDRMLEALVDYFREYPPDSDPVKPYIMKDGKPAVEFTFAIPTDVSHPVSGDPILFCGRFDLLGYYNSELFIIDEKTTKSLGTFWLQQWDMRGQFMGYCYAAQQYGFPVSRSLIRGIGILKTKITHLQALNTYPQWQLENWWMHLNAKLFHLVDRWKAAGDGPTDTDAWNMSYGEGCAAYGGCHYKSLCLAHPDKRPNWLSEYVISQWDPLAVDPSHTKEAAKTEAEEMTGTWEV